VELAEVVDETGKFEVGGGGEEMLYSGVVRTFKRFKRYNKECSKTMGLSEMKESFIKDVTNKDSLVVQAAAPVKAALVATQPVIQVKVVEEDNIFKSLSSAADFKPTDFTPTSLPFQPNSMPFVPTTSS